ncbi:MAG: hypothetical protein ABL931_11565 [Usitatibacteraceae bacterium]
MDIDILRTLQFCGATIVPMWVIGPLMRRGRRYWIALVPIFLLLVSLNYLVTAEKLPTETAPLRALALATLSMVFGYIWCRFAMPQLEKHWQDAKGIPPKAKS